MQNWLQRSYCLDWKKKLGGNQSLKFCIGQALVLHSLGFIKFFDIFLCTSSLKLWAFCWLPLPVLSSFQGALYKTSFLLLSDTVMNANSSFFLSLTSSLDILLSLVKRKLVGDLFEDMCECEWMWLSGCVEKAGTGASAFSTLWMKQEWKKMKKQQFGKRPGMYGLKKCGLITSLWSLFHMPKAHFLFTFTYS